MDLYNLSDTSQKVQVFTTSGVWHKPRGISMVYIHAVGAGSGGSAGTSGALGTSRAGGGGGSGGNVSRLCIPAVLISDSLIISVGIGGSGGTVTAGSGTSGILGGDTNIISARGTAANSTNLLWTQGGPAPVLSTGGPGSGANSISNTPFAALGVNFFLGSPGGGAGTTTVGTSVNWATVGANFLTSGGGGGAGSTAINDSYAGGTVTGNAIVPSSIGGASGGGEGAGGVFSWSPLYQVGGAGGGSNGTGTGGRGGDGAPGCGVGGGGGGVTAGAGGKGGDGYVVIVCW